MANVLSFALGLETGAWPAALESGGRELLSFLSIAEAGRFTIDKFAEAIRDGGDAFRKSFATGVSTGHLVQLTEAFKAVGLESSEVETISFRLQRALTGVSDSGGRTELAFGRLGLNMRALRSLSPDKQILATSDAFQKLDRSAQTGVASILFGGRGGAASFLQLARQGEQFRDAFARAAQDAATFQKLGGLFNNLNIRAIEIKSHISAMFAEAAAGFAGPLQSALDKLERFPWHKIGQDAAVIFNGLFKVFEEGKVGLLLGDAFRTGFEVGQILIGPFFGRLFIEAENFGDFLTITLLKTFEDVLVKFHVQLIHLFQQFRFDAGITSKKPESLPKLYRRVSREDDLRIGALNETMNADVSQRRSDNNKEWKDAFDAILNGPLKKFSSAWKDFFKPPQLNGPQSQDQPGSPNALMTPPIRNASQYEKLGFVLSTVASMSGDHARQTAQNTAAIAAKMDKLISVAENNNHGGNSMHHAP